VLAAMQAVRVIATPAGTRIADRYGSLHGAIVVTAFVSIAAIALLASIQGFPFVFMAAVMLAFVSAPLLPLTDAYGLKGLAQRGKSYGPVRLWGSVAFIAANLTGGVLLDTLAPANLIWVIFAGNCALGLATILLVSQPRNEAPRPSEKSGHSHLRQPVFLAIAAAGSLIQASHAVYYGFSTLDWSAKGFDGVTMGALWALGVTAEIVLFALAGRMPVTRPATLILVGAAGGLIRWALMVFDPPLALLAPLQLLHALSFGATHLGTMAYLSQAAPQGNRAAAQGDIATASSLMMAAASALAGVMYGMNGSIAYAGMAALAAAGGGFALLAARLMRADSSAP
jgi:MFS transporter, PPP family, 3-phenylpropionic acid transporter